MRPRWWYSHHSVPAIGLTSVDQRQPGSKVMRPTTKSPRFQISVRPLRDRPRLVRHVEGLALHAAHRPTPLTRRLRRPMHRPPTAGSPPRRARPASVAAESGTGRIGRPARGCRRSRADRRGARTSRAGSRRSRLSASGPSDQSARLNGPSAFLRVLYRNCSSVSPGLRSSAQLARHQAIISARSASGRPPSSYRMFWKPVARWISARPVGREVVERLLGQGARPVLDAAGQAVLVAGHGREPRAGCRSRSLTVRHAAVGQHHAAVAGPGLDADLADPRRAAVPCERRRNSRPGRRAAPPRWS